MKLASSFVAAALLTGCASPVTVADVEGQQGSGFDLVVAAPPEVVYRRLVERSRECLQAGELRVDADFFPGGTGRVTLVQAAAGGMTLTTTRIGPAPQGSALRVSYHDPHRSGKPSIFTDHIGAWANGQPGECLAERFKPRPHVDRSR